MNQTQFRRTGRGRLLLLMLALAAIWPSYRWWQEAQFRSALQLGQKYLNQRREELAEEQFEICRQIHPQDTQSILLWSEAVMTGRSRTGAEAAELVLSGLRQISDEDAAAAEIRMREGRLLLFVLNRPDAAERMLRRSLALDDRPVDAWYLLWKLYDLTGRFEQAEPFYLATYERTTSEYRPMRLREWYLSQFSQGAANAELDRRMGFLGPDELAGDATVDRRLQAFVDAEPDSLLNQTAQAAFFVQLRDRDKALQTLLRLQQHEEAAGNAWYLSLTIELLLELGRLDEAAQLADAWQAARDGYLWHRCAGRISQLVRREDEAAVDHFRQARQEWPGNADWSLLHFEAQSLARLGRGEESKRLREQADRIEKLTELDLHRGIRIALQQPNAPATVSEMIAFYSALGRTQEVEAWKQVGGLSAQGSFE